MNLNSAIILFLDKQKFYNKEELKLAIEEYFEEYFENRFEYFQNIPAKFEEAKRKIEILTLDYIQLKNLIFKKENEIILLVYNNQKYIGKILKINLNRTFLIGNLVNIKTLEKLSGSLSEILISENDVLMILDEGD